NTPDSPAKPPDDRMDQGGNYWTLFTPGIWKVLHAVLDVQSATRFCRGYDELRSFLRPRPPHHQPVSANYRRLHVLCAATTVISILQAV
ncbi:MAG: hypothetical protein ACJ8AI_12790, partial [Rhodopila sp.]